MTAKKTTPVKVIVPDVAIATPKQMEQGAHLPGGLPSASDLAPAADSHDEIAVEDPQLLRPVDLPLVIKPAKGSDWKNNEQSEYAKILNAAAYANPTTWATVKDVEIARLKEIGENPDAYYKYTGTQRGPNNLTLKRSDTLTS